MTRNTRSPDLAEVIDSAITSRLLRVNVALPGRVEKWDPATQKADVKPLIQSVEIDRDGNDVVDVLPVIPDVPVMFPRANSFFMSFPVKVGDHVLLIFNSRSIDIWSQGNGPDTNPVDPRMHDLSDAVALPGFYPFGKPLNDVHADNIVIGKDGGDSIHIKSDAGDGTVHLGEENAAEFVSLGDKTDQRFQDLEDNLNDLRSDYTDFVTMTYGVHTHVTTATVGPSAAPGTIAPTTTQGTGVPIPYPDGSSVAASKVKAT